jgi:hypothetical protein
MALLPLSPALVSPSGGVGAETGVADDEELELEVVAVEMTVDREKCALNCPSFPFCMFSGCGAGGKPPSRRAGGCHCHCATPSLLLSA